MKKILKIIFSSLSIYIILLFLGAFLTLKFEETDNSANIKTYNNSLWWCINATSVGNSEIYPITLGGRIVGVFIILVGYGLFMINVATISSMLNHFINKELKEKK